MTDAASPPTISWEDLANAVAMCATASWDPINHPAWKETLDRFVALSDGGPDGHGQTAPAAPVEPPLPAGGKWMAYSFMGFDEPEGYVTEITVGGELVFHIDLPEKVWGGNPDAYVEFSARALRSRKPVTEESLRARWDSQVRAAGAAERRRLEREEWERQQDLRALPAGDGYDGGQLPAGHFGERYDEDGGEPADGFAGAPDVEHPF